MVCLINCISAGSAQPQSHTVRTRNRMPSANAIKPAPISAAPASGPETEKTAIDRNAEIPVIISAMPAMMQIMPATPIQSVIAIILKIKPKTALITVHATENQIGDVSTRRIMIRAVFDLSFSCFAFAVWLLLL